MKKITILILLISFPIFGQINLKNNVFQLNEFNDAISIEEAIIKYNQGEFDKPFPIETYKYFNNKEASWIVFKIDSLKNDTYFSIENSLFEELKLYQITNGEITIPNDLNKKGIYRFPLWLFEKNNDANLIFIRTKDKLSYRTEYNMVTFSKTEFINKVEKDYFLIGSYMLSMLILIIAASSVFVFKKEYVLLWYTIHLIFLSIEYLISTGSFSQWFLDNSIILKYGLDHITMLLSIIALCEFYRGYFKYNRKTLVYKNIYIIITICCALVIVYSVIDGICGNIFNVEWWAQNILTYGSLAALICQFFLAYHKVIPKYIFVAFALPIIGIFANLGGLKSYFENENVVYFIFNSVYIGIIIGGIIMTMYIIKVSVGSEIKAIKLTKENNLLKSNFQENLATIQEKHQNILVNDVHDSFGGYLEALKLNLIAKERNEQQIYRLLEAFRKDYKLLLNSLFVPNIDADNFENSIQEYCDKMNALSSSDIQFTSKKEKFVQLPKNTAKLIYKAASELTTNAIKYAKSKSITVDLKVNKKEIKLKVIDDGVGFNIKSLNNTSLGISGIKERVETLNGEFEINSRKSNGTTITIIIPIKRN